MALTKEDLIISMLKEQGKKLDSLPCSETRERIATLEARQGNREGQIKALWIATLAILGWFVRFEFFKK